MIRIGKLTCGHVELSGASDRLTSNGRLGRLVEDIHDRGAIKPRSWRDRTAILARSNRDRGAIEPQSSHLHRGINATIIKRCSFENRDHDRLSIVARSRRDRGAIVTPIEAESRPIHHHIGSHDIANGNRSHDAFNPPPRPHHSATIFGLNFPLKACILPSCSSTFDRFMK